MAKNDQPDYALPAEFLRLGDMLSSMGSLRRPIDRSSERQRVSAEEVGAMADALLDKACKVSAARRVLGLRQGFDRDAAHIRLKAVAVLGWQRLRASVGAIAIGDLAAACADPRLPPNEGLLRARHEIGAMMAEDTLVGSVDASGTYDKVCLSPKGQETLAGGKSSMGLLTANKLAGILLPKGMDEYERPAADAPIPSAADLRAKICEKVIGLDLQVSALSSLLVMHLARGRLIRSGRDGGNNFAILLVASSGSGKTWMMETASSVISCPFASGSATAWTSEAYIGGKLDDLFKALVFKAKGSIQEARFGIAFADEWDSKAMREGRDVTTLAIQQECLVPMQGGEFLISGKRSMERPITFDSRGTFFVFAGAFAGLHELIRKRNGRESIGFATPSGASTRRHRYILDAIAEYGYLKTWTNRLCSVLFLPDPTAESLGRAAAHGILDGINAILGELGIVLFPHGAAIPRMAAYAIESRTFFRGLKSIWWSLAEQAVASGEKGTVLVGTAEVDAAIGRVASGSVGLPGACAPAGEAPSEGMEECNAGDGNGCASGGG